MKSIDHELCELVALVRRMGDDRLVLYVHCDGRVDLFGEGPAVTRWTLRADVGVGSSLPLPSVAIATLVQP